MRLGWSEGIKPRKCNILPAENYFTPSGNGTLLKSASFEETEYMGMKYPSPKYFLYFVGDLRENTDQGSIFASLVLPIIVFNFLHHNISVTHKESENYIYDLQLG